VARCEFATARLGGGRESGPQGPEA